MAKGRLCPVNPGEYVKDGRLRKEKWAQANIVLSPGQKYFFHPGQAWVCESDPHLSFKIVDIFLDEALFPIRDYGWQDIIREDMLNWRFTWEVLSVPAFIGEAERRFGKRPVLSELPFCGVYPMKFMSEGIGHKGVRANIIRNNMTSETNNWKTFAEGVFEEYYPHAICFDDK